MRLIIGGAYQGKKQAALAMTGLDSSAIIDGAECSPRQLKQALILDRFHELVRRGMGMQERSLQETEPIGMEEIEGFVRGERPGRPDVTVICDELGCGVVPFEKNDRMWREKTGRLLCELAARADEVYRVSAGIAQRIK